MIDLTNAKENPFKTYDGVNGKKKCLIYTGTGTKTRTNSAKIS